MYNYFTYIQLCIVMSINDDDNPRVFIIIIDVATLIGCICKKIVPHKIFKLNS